MIASRLVPACAVASVIAGCATLPEFHEPPPTTAEIVRHVRCELRDALKIPGNEWLTDPKTWLVKLSFTFDIQHSGDVSTDNNFTFPLNAGATFGINFTGGVTGTGNRTENMEFDQRLQQLRDDKSLHCPDEQLGRYDRLAGYLGIADLLERASRSREKTPMQAGSISKLAYTVEFIIKRNGTVTPKFNLIPIGTEKAYTGSAKWLGSRSDTQKLVLTFTPSPDKEEDCDVVVADLGAPWMAPRRCPAPVYQVNVRPACGIIPFDTMCKDRKDCALPPGSKSCLPACHVLFEKKQCDARKQDCVWDAHGKSCAMSEAEKRRVAKEEALQKSRPRALQLTPRSLVVAPPAAQGGLSPRELDTLDRASSRTINESIDLQLRRQGVVP
jgi:hypothetical protein